MPHCPAKDDSKSQWPAFCPNVGAAYLFAILFGLTTIAHLSQAIIYRKGYAWVITMSATWQTVCYIFRILSINNVESSGYYSGWFILMLLAPLWTNAFVYMVLGRMTYNYTVQAKILGIKAWRFGLWFVLLDILAFIVQAAGASMASGSNISQSQIMNGLHMYMGGIGLQEFFVLCFIFLTFQFQKQMNCDIPFGDKSDQKKLLYVLYTVLVFISIRIIFRLIEYANGYKSGIPVHEAYQYIFDSLIMFIALFLFNVFHPGRIMPGKECDFPSRKQRKAAGKEKVWGRAAEFNRDGDAGFESNGDASGMSAYPSAAKGADGPVSVGYLADV